MGGSETLIVQNFNNPALAEGGGRIQYDNR